MNWAGDSHDAYSVIIDSALGLLGARAQVDKSEFLERGDWLHEYLGETAAAEVSVPDRRAKAPPGKTVFDAQLRELPRERAHRHAHARSPRSAPTATGLDTWNKEAAIAANKVVSDMGIERKGLVEETLDGYIAAVPRRHLAARAVPAQRLGADAARSARAAGEAAEGVLPRLRRLRSGERRLRIAGRRGAAHRHQARDLCARRLATRATRSAPR